MKIFIPPLGTELQLAKVWSFSLHNESRNESLFEYFGLKYDENYWHRNRSVKPQTVSLPVGSILIMDRIYIRRGLDEFDSVTFRLKGCKTKTRRLEKTATYHYEGGLAIDKPYIKTKPARPVRFWANLEDVNAIEAKVIEGES